MTHERTPADRARQRTYSVLTAIFLFTLPLYCLGFVALAVAPDPNRPRTPTLSPIEATLTALATLMPTATVAPPTAIVVGTPGEATATLPSTPTQFVPPTRTIT
ncbi:MAG TPA: hypothetical protein PK954_13845, partial [Anaerolineales bacterium]|nr:hypothetical protein [Anaerolineales bacterium]